MANHTEAGHSGEPCGGDDLVPHRDITQVHPLRAWWQDEMHRRAGTRKYGHLHKKLEQKYCDRILQNVKS